LATKKKTVVAKRKTTKDDAGPPVDEDGFLVLPKPLLMEYRALDAECRHAGLSLRITSQELEGLLTKHPEIQRAIQQKGALIAEAANKKNALTELHTQIEKTYSIKIAEIAIDDDTGRIHQLVGGAAVPDGLRPTVPPPKKRARRGAKAKTT
jgi:hypothetical protein